MNEEIEKEDLACCGNCEFRHGMDMGDVVEEKCKINSIIGLSCSICPMWKFDVIEKKNRMIRFERNGNNI